MNTLHSQPVTGKSWRTGFDLRLNHYTDAQNNTDHGHLRGPAVLPPNRQKQDCQLCIARHGARIP